MTSGQARLDNETSKFMAISGTLFNSIGSQTAVVCVLVGLQSGTTNQYLPVIVNPDGYLINSPAV